MRESETVSGLSNISVPVHSRDGNILAALTVPYLKQRNAHLTPERVMELQLEASERMRKGLG
jgi:DNA-binding IclR family transcriptional regulator